MESMGKKRKQIFEIEMRFKLHQLSVQLFDTFLTIKNGDFDLYE